MIKIMKTKIVPILIFILLIFGGMSMEVFAEELSVEKEKSESNIVEDKYNTKNNNEKIEDEKIEEDKKTEENVNVAEDIEKTEENVNVEKDKRKEDTENEAKKIEEDTNDNDQNVIVENSDKGQFDEKKSGLVENDGKMYLYNSDGTLHQEWGTPVYNGKKYWTRGDGTVVSGWLYLNDWKMYFDLEDYTAAIGFKEINENMYLFNDDGVMQNYAGTTIVNGKKYWFSDKDASLKTGWLYLGQMKLFFDTKTYEGYVNGIYTIDNKKYVFDQNGVVLNNNVDYVQGWNIFDGKKIYGYENDTMAKGLQLIDGKTYLFSNDGVLCQKCGTPLYNGNKYWVNDAGEVLSGWLHLNNWKMYFDIDSYEAAVGIKEVKKLVYLFNNDGVMQELQ